MEEILITSGLSRYMEKVLKTLLVRIIYGKSPMN
jgi:hypothetical protein